MCTINKSAHTKKSLETYRMHLVSLIGAAALENSTFFGFLVMRGWPLVLGQRLLIIILDIFYNWHAGTDQERKNEMLQFHRALWCHWTWGTIRQIQMWRWRTTQNCEIPCSPDTLQVLLTGFACMAQSTTLESTLLDIPDWLIIEVLATETKLFSTIWLLYSDKLHLHFS